MLDRKLLRDLSAVKAQVITIALVMASTIGAFTASLSTYDSLKTLQQTYYESARFAHVFAQVRRAPLDVEYHIANIPGVAEAETTLSHDVLLDLPDVIEPLTGRLIALPDGGPARMNRLTLMAGRWIDAPGSNQVLVNQTFAEYRSLKPGDRVAALLDGKREQLEVVGIVLSPEYVFAGRGGLGDESSFGIFWMGRPRLAAAYDMEGAFNSVARRFGVRRPRCTGPAARAVWQHRRLRPRRAMVASCTDPGDQRAADLRRGAACDLPRGRGLPAQRGAQPPDRHAALAAGAVSALIVRRRIDRLDLIGVLKTRQ